MITTDMTKGEPWKLIFGFSVPLMIGNIFQQFYTVVDTIVVGKAFGVNGLAALGASEWMIFFLFGSIQGLVQGFSVPIAQRFGAGDFKGLRKAVAGAGFLSMLGAIVFSMAGQWVIEPVLRLLDTPNEIIGMSKSYLVILYAGIPVAMAYNLFAAILRSLGNSKTPLRAMTIASAVNIILDIVFVFGAKWGIKGAAFATVLAQLFAALFCFYALCKIEAVRSIRKEKGLLCKKICWEQIKIAFPMGLQNMITAIGGLVVQAVVNSFGIVFMAAFTAAVKLYGLLEIAASSYGYAMSAYTAQNKGAASFDRIKKGMRAGSAIGGITATAMAGIMIIFGRSILRNFVSGEQEIVQEAVTIGYEFLIILSVFFIFLYLLYIIRACLQGMGNSIMPMCSSIVQLLMRVSCALILPRFIGYSGVFWGEVTAWIGANILLLFAYTYEMKKRIT